MYKYMYINLILFIFSQNNMIQAPVVQHASSISRIPSYFMSETNISERSASSAEALGHSGSPIKAHFNILAVQLPRQ